MHSECIICMESLEADSHMSACPCGHVFHEDCLFRWLSSDQQTCPQCRAHVEESSVIKRLFFAKSNEPVQQYSDELPKICEQLSAQVDELSAECKQKEQNLAQQSEINTALNLQIDQLKTSFNNSVKMCKELELKLDNFKTIQMIYTKNEPKFSSEMEKNFNENMSISDCCCSIRKLVNANVLLKSELDKKNDEIVEMRRKLVHLENINNNDNNRQRYLNEKYSKNERWQSRKRYYERDNDEETTNHGPYANKYHYYKRHYNK